MGIRDIRKGRICFIAPSDWVRLVRMSWTASPLMHDARRATIGSSMRHKDWRSEIISSMYVFCSCNFFLSSAEGFSTDTILRRNMSQRDLVQHHTREMIASSESSSDITHVKKCSR